MPQIDRISAILGLLAGVGGAMAILLFWIIAALTHGTGAGLVSQLELSGAWATGFWAYPFVTFAAVAAAAVAFFANANAIAVGVAGLPVALTVVYYVALVSFR